jgi:hypothetical protein
MSPARPAEAPITPPADSQLVMPRRAGGMGEEKHGRAQCAPTENPAGCAPITDEVAGSDAGCLGRFGEGGPALDVVMRADR